MGRKSEQSRKKAPGVSLTLAHRVRSPFPKEKNGLLKSNFRERRDLFSLKLADVLRREEIATDDPERWMKLSIALLRRYEPGFHTETRGRRKLANIETAQGKSSASKSAIEISKLKLVSDSERRKAGLPPLSIAAFSTYLAKKDNQGQLPPVYRGKSAQTIRKALALGAKLAKAALAAPELVKK